MSKYIKNWFSNMTQLNTPIIIDGISYPSVENAYQAAKTMDISERERIATLTPNQSKKAGQKVELRENWEPIKLAVMFICLMHKFSQPKWKAELKATGSEYLVEWNNWGDSTWGIPCKMAPNRYAIPSNQVGYNLLGRLLMLIRSAEEIIDINCYFFDETDELYRLSDRIFKKLPPIPEHKVVEVEPTHYETATMPTARISVAAYGSNDINAITPEIAERLDNIINLGAQVHLIQESAVTSIVKEYFDYKKYSRITWHETLKTFNTQYGLLIKGASDSKNYKYHSPKFTRTVVV